MIWAEFENLCRWRYRLMPLNPALGISAQKLRSDLGPLCKVSASPGRPDFYEVDAPGGWYYVHVHHTSRTVYVVAHSPSSGVGRGSGRSARGNVRPSFAPIGA
jgi:hypothetical protein